ncbi:Uncharacterised protein [uncultured archaeon]|nr:Uncharacterised protein [uncultured archaeon]
MNKELGILLIGAGIGMAGMQYVLPKLGTVVSSFAWIIWFVLLIVGVFFVIKHD